MTECRWQWCKPDKPGLWWYGGQVPEMPVIKSLIQVDVPSAKNQAWYAYIGPIPPEPLPPKRKVTQTRWMVPIVSDRYAMHWLSPDDTIPPGAIETVQKREVEL